MPRIIAITSSMNMHHTAVFAKKRRKRMKMNEAATGRSTPPTTMKISPSESERTTSYL